MQSASFNTSSMVWLARCKILVPLQLMGWSSAQACSAIADLSVWHLTQASLCSGSEASIGLSDVDFSTRAWYLVHDVRLLLDGERVSEHGPESRGRPSLVLRGEGKGRPGTHCMRMRHYSPDFGESGYVWILSVYLHRKLHVFKVMMSVSHIDATRTQPACPHGKRWVWLAILCPSLRRR